MRDHITESISSEMPQQPVVVVASLLSLGAALGWLVWLDWWALILFGALAVALYLYCRKWWMGLLLILYSSLSMTMIHRLASGEVSGEGYYLVEVLDAAQQSRRGVLKIRSRLSSGDTEWSGCYGEVRYRADDDLSLLRGERAVVWCRVWEFRGRHYANLSQRSIVSREGVVGGAITRWAESCNEWAMSRLRGLELSPKAEALCGAMLLGRRDLLSGETIVAHSRSGAAHILALSGLHVMILYFVVSRLLLLLNLVPFGFRLRPILLALVVWFYAQMVGMTPSVERAAIMFILLQAFWFFSRHYESLAGLMVAVAVMTLFDPSIVFDVGFMLSVVAVVAILTWVVPLDRRFTIWSRDYFGRFSGLVSMLVTTFMVGVACSVATLPLVSMSFGYISPMGVLLNPLLILLAYIILSLSLLWTLFGFDLVAPLFRWVLDGVAQVEYEAVAYMSSDWRDAVDVRLSLLSVVVIYIIFIVATIIVRRYKED